MGEIPDFEFRIVYPGEQHVTIANMMVAEIRGRLEKLADQETAEILRRFFKTGPGEYGEGDMFRGIRVPVLRKLCREFSRASVDDAVELLASGWHEDRLLALLLLVERSRQADEALRTLIYTHYCSHTDRINNWDLVDLSCPRIVGCHLQERDRSPLYRFALSESLWERRIAIVSTFHFIRADDFDDTLAIAEKLMEDTEDLIHKATGWMLREVGKRNEEVLEGFLSEYYSDMPRTMLRYAIEKLPEPRRQAWLKGRV